MEEGSEEIINVTLQGQAASLPEQDKRRIKIRFCCSSEEADINFPLTVLILTFFLMALTSPSLLECSKLR